MCGAALDNGQRSSRKPLPPLTVVALLCATALTLCACGDSDGNTEAVMDVSVTQTLAAGDQDSIYVWGYLCGATNPSATSPMYLSERLSTDERPCDEPRLIVRGGSCYVFVRRRSSVCSRPIPNRAGGNLSHDLAMYPGRGSAWQGLVGWDH